MTDDSASAGTPSSLNGFSEIVSSEPLHLGGNEEKLLQIGAEIVSVDAAQADAARRGWRRYGKGHHAAAPNYGTRWAQLQNYCSSHAA
jgi:hypothetical protein